MLLRYCGRSRSSSEVDPMASWYALRAMSKSADEEDLLFLNRVKNAFPRLFKCLGSSGSSSVVELTEFLFAKIALATSAFDPVNSDRNLRAFPRLFHLAASSSSPFVVNLTARS